MTNSSSIPDVVLVLVCYDTETRG